MSVDLGRAKDLLRLLFVCEVKMTSRSERVGKSGQKGSETGVRKAKGSGIAKDPSLANRVALVCGASEGIGRATCLEFARLGASVVALSRSQLKLAALSDEMVAKGFAAPILLPVDLGETETLLKHIDKVLVAVKAIHVVVHNLGGPVPGPLATASQQDLERAFRAHVVSAQWLMQRLLPGMKSANYGRFIQVLSTSVKAPLPNLGVSNVIRAAMANWAKTLALEVGEFGITVNNVLPGYTRTQRLAALAKAVAQNKHLEVSEVEDLWRGQVPLKRFADPTETAEVIGFLASPMAAYIHGINLPVDGGRLVCL